MSRKSKVAVAVTFVVVFYLTAVITVHVKIQGYRSDFDRAASSENPMLDALLEKYSNSTPLDAIATIISESGLSYARCSGTKTPDEFLRTKYGDCSEFACLAAYVFDYFGMPNKVCMEERLLEKRDRRGHIYNRVFVNQSIAIEDPVIRYSFDGEPGWYYIDFYGERMNNSAYSSASRDTSIKPQYVLDGYVPIIETMLFCAYWEWSIR